MNNPAAPQSDKWLRSASTSSIVLLNDRSLAKMGFQIDSQERLFYSFNLEDHVPQNHILRGINQYLDLNELHPDLAEHYSNIGSPSIDPELMIRMLIIGYSFDICYERRLCEEVHRNLAYRWFCRLGLKFKSGVALQNEIRAYCHLLYNQIRRVRKTIKNEA
jgi:hypothetical protein